MTKRIAIAGKGGTGKTTLAALLVRFLMNEKKGADILTVDADANANLNEALGLEVEETVSSILEDTKDPKAVPAGMTKDVFVEYRLSRAMVEEDAFDLLVMGNPEGPGCYCYPNDLLKKYLETLSKNYDYMVIDNEAGLEHLSRRLLPMVDLLLVTSDATARGIRSAGRVRDIVEKVKMDVTKMGLVISRSRDGEAQALDQEIKNSGLELIGEIGHDSLVADYDLNGRPLLSLPDDSRAVQDSRKLFQALTF